MKNTKTKLFLHLFISSFFLFGLVGVSEAADHNWYFSMSGGGNVCSQVSPCKWLSSNQVGYVAGQTTAQNKIDSVGSDKTVNLYFKRGDVWSFNTDMVSTKVYYGLLVNSDDPTVNIDTYGLGAKPIFDGTVTDFSSVPNHDHTITTGPYKWNNIFQFNRNDCSVKNIHINGIYGQGIVLGDASNATDNFTLESSDITNFGNCAIRSSSKYATRNTTVTKNLIHTGQQLQLYGKWPIMNWGAGIMITPLNHFRTPYGNVINYNVVYDIAGEGIHAFGTTIEHNIVGDTGSVGIFVAPDAGDATDTIVRYNLVIMSDLLSSDYDNDGAIAHEGIGIADEGFGGSNVNAIVKVYGNIVINRLKGIFFAAYNGSVAPWKEIHIYNNTIIDSSGANMVISEPAHDMVAVGKGFIYNNTSILYDITGSIHVADWSDPPALSTYWTIENNHFWTTGGSPTVDTDWQTNMITTDPQLTGEPLIDWDGQSGPTYYKDIKFSDVIPLAGSSLIGSGKTLDASYNKTFLTQGTDFSALPNLTNFTLSSQTDGSWDIGAVEMAVPADHNWYFSMSGGGNVCSQAAPCKWLSSNQVGYVAGQTTAQDKIDSIASDKIVNLYFKRGDVWTADTSAVNKINCHGLLVSATNPIININAYGSGNKPAFDGLVSDFSTAPAHNSTTGPLFYNRFFEFKRNSCSISNIEIKRVYGNAVFLNPSNYFTLDSCNIHNFGAGGISISSAVGGNNITVINNIFHTGQELYRYGLRSGWEAAIQLTTKGHLCEDNVIRYNVVYDIYGEGIQCVNSLCEYNIVGDTGSIALNTSNHGWDAKKTTVRYNIVTMSDWGSSIYDTLSGSSPVGVRVYDEHPGGNNSGADIQIYGNIIINTRNGIQLGSPEDPGNPYGSVKIYNNTLVDCISNWTFSQPEEFSNVHIYNNSSIHYDRTGAHSVNWDIAAGYSGWVFDYNHFYPVDGSNTVLPIFASNQITTDPKLIGEPTIDWDGQSGATYYKDIKFSDVIPLATSSLIGSGKTLDASYNKTFLTQGTNFDTLPNTPNFMLSSQTDGSWDIGAVEVGGAIITCASLGGTCCAPFQICQGGSAATSSCSNVCCVGGTCQNVAPPPPPPPPTCQSQGHKCCFSCHTGPHPIYDGDCVGERICCDTCPPPPKASMKNFISVLNFSNLVENFLVWTLSIIGSLSLLIIVVGGVMYIGSTGDEQRIVTAKRAVTYAIIGLGLILSAYAVIMVLGKVLN
ncbi:MAG: right-handed parallel beta-helix repeat-containing protein [Candidatus Pacebacteria bacterium]|nr:right-handed parallel beta-helix repeat-containing protein [Candidatus Paceibacterota bacterium]